MTTVVTNSGMVSILQAKYEGTLSVPTKMKIGIGTINPTTSDTTLEKKVPVIGTEAVDSFDAITGWSAGTDSVVSLNNSIFKEGTGSVSLAKTGTSGVSMSMDKTVTSLDFTSKDFWTWIYVTDVSELITSGTAFSIRYGSDSSNYYQFDVVIGSLSNGWNYVTFSSGTATSTTGTPTITACDYLYFAFFTDNPSDLIAADQVMIDDSKLASTTDYDVTMQVGYPAVNVGSLLAESRARLGTTDANGTPVSEFGVFQSGDDVDGRTVIDEESKSNTDIFVMSEKIRLRLQSSQPT